METYTFCQSCGFPLKKDKKGGGSEKDGTVSKKYCSMCYENGAFLSPPEVDTPEKMQQFCIREMKKDGMNGIFAGLPHALYPGWNDGRNELNLIRMHHFFTGRVKMICVELLADVSRLQYVAAADEWNDLRYFLI